MDITPSQVLYSSGRVKRRLDHRAHCARLSLGWVIGFAESRLPRRRRDAETRREAKPEGEPGRESPLSARSVDYSAPQRWLPSALAKAEFDLGSLRQTT